jgi:hypothetical protein
MPRAAEARVQPDLDRASLAAMTGLSGREGTMKSLWSKAAYLIWIVPAGFCIGALWPQPYVYYEWLRMVVGLPAAFFAAMIFVSGIRFALAWSIAFAVVALVFNPFAPVHLSREVWAPIDVAVAGLFLANLAVAWRSDRARIKKPDQ